MGEVEEVQMAEIQSSCVELSKTLKNKIRILVLDNFQQLHKTVVMLQVESKYLA